VGGSGRQVRKGGLLSSKSENLFLVNFQTKKPMMPRTATPAATDIPMMEPVDRPPSPSSDPDWLVVAAAAEAVEVPVPDWVVVTRTAPSGVAALGAGEASVGED
jgi:hypothetical protein